MAIDTFGIPLAYLIVTSLLLWAVIAARGNWGLKIAIIASALIFGVGLWYSLHDIQGWPVAAEMPDRFEVKWLIVEEPDKKRGGKGAIYVWAVALGSDPPSLLRFIRKGGTKEPRIYRLPYSRPLHEQSEKISREIRSGKRYFAVLRRGEGDSESFAASRGGPASAMKGKGSDANMRGKKWQEGELSGGSVSYQDYIFHELPPAKFPEKSLPE